MKLQSGSYAENIRRITEESRLTSNDGDYDPFDSPEERAELGSSPLPFTGKEGVWSTWRERHISLAGFLDGLTRPIWRGLPDCPEKWKDEPQYYRTGSIFGAGIQVCGWILLVRFAPDLLRFVASGGIL